LFRSLIEYEEYWKHKHKEGKEKEDQKECADMKRDQLENKR